MSAYDRDRFVHALRQRLALDDIRLVGCGPGRRAGAFLWRVTASAFAVATVDVEAPDEHHYCDATLADVVAAIRAALDAVQGARP